MTTRTVVAVFSLFLAIVFYGLCLAWIINLALVGGLFSIPQMLYSLGWEAAIYGTTLLVLGTFFLFVSASLVDRHRAD